MGWTLAPLEFRDIGPSGAELTLAADGRDDSAPSIKGVVGSSLYIATALRRVQRCTASDRQRWDTYIDERKVFRACTSELRSRSGAIACTNAALIAQVGDDCRA